VSQIRGGAVAGCGGAFLSPVSNVSASTANAAQRSTTAVSVVYQSDSSDANFSQAKVFIRDYHGNQS
jgi:hypothetical protein